MASKKTFLYRNRLSLALVLLFLISLAGQCITGWHEYNNGRNEHGKGEVRFSEYFRTGHFLQVTFENWESEFLQMALYVMLTISLRQQGSSESKSLDEKEEVDREPDPNKSDAPKPVKKGGVYLAIYKNSLSIAFALLFLFSFVIHAIGSLKNFNEEQIMKHQQTLAMTGYLGEPRFWFESFQNWQSEFLAVLSIVVLSIFLRQKGSPESKPVDASHEETGTG